MSNVSKEVKALKVKGRKLLKAGLDSGYIAENLRVSKKLVKEWEEEYVKELLADGHGQRVRLRSMLMRMTPTVLMGLQKLATQEIEPRMQLAASQAIVRFGISFMREDSLMQELEQKAKESTGAALMRETLFDFPDEIAQDVILREERQQEAADDDGLEYDREDTIDAEGDGEPDEAQEKTTAESSGNKDEAINLETKGDEDKDDDIGDAEEGQEPLF